MRTPAAPRESRDHHDDFGGLSADLGFTSRVSRRTALRAAVGVGLGAGLAPLLGCADGSAATDSGGTTPNASCARIPEETAGPFPGDGSNGPNVLTTSGVVRSDLRSSFGGLSGTTDGVALTVVLTLVNLQGGCVAAPGRAVYLWHCNRAGLYSLYNAGATDQNWLRGVQAADSDGVVRFTTVFPGCYAGRWPHMHFEVYDSLAAAASVSNKRATSQLAFPADVCQTVYGVAGYESSATNLRGVSLTSDNIFADGVATQLATMSGSVSEGYTARLTVAV